METVADYCGKSSLEGRGSERKQGSDGSGGEVDVIRRSGGDRGSGGTQGSGGKQGSGGRDNNRGSGGSRDFQCSDEASGVRVGEGDEGMEEEQGQEVVDVDVGGGCVTGEMRFQQQNQELVGNALNLKVSI